MDSTHQLMELYQARQKYGGFMRHKIETILPDGTTATMIGGILRAEGVITVADKTYQVARSVMNDGIRGVADYTIDGCPIGPPSVRLNDLERKRSYVLRQRRIWSSTLVLLENATEVGDFRWNCLQSRYRILVDHGVPTKMVLLCVWVVMVRGEFTA